MSTKRSNKTYNANPGVFQYEKDLDAIEGVNDHKNDIFSQLKHAYNVYSLGADKGSEKGFGYRLLGEIYKECEELGYEKKDIWDMEKKAAAQSNWGKAQFISEMVYSNGKTPLSMKAFTR